MKDMNWILTSRAWLAGLEPWQSAVIALLIVGVLFAFVAGLFPWESWISEDKKDKADPKKAQKGKRQLKATLSLLSVWLIVSAAIFLSANWENFFKEVAGQKKQPIDGILIWIRLGLTVITGILFWRAKAGLQRLFIDELHLEKPAEAPSTTASFSGLVLITIGGLMIIWLPAMWLLALTVLAAGYALSGSGAGRANEVLVPTMFNEWLRATGDEVSRMRVLQMLRAGFIWIPIPWWLLGFQFTRIRNDHEVVNAHVTPEVSTKGEGENPGALAKVISNTTWRYGEWPYAFLKLSPQDKEKLQEAVLSAVDAFVQIYASRMSYQEVEAWKFAIDPTFFKELRKRLRVLGVELLSFEVVNVQSNLDRETDKLATEQVTQDIENLRTKERNQRAIDTAEANSKALKMRLDGFLRVLGHDPTNASQEQRQQAMKEMQRVSIADNPNYLMPPNLSGTASAPTTGLGLSVMVPNQPRPPQS